MSCKALIPDTTLSRLNDYLSELRTGKAVAGKRLLDAIAGKDLTNLSSKEFLVHLLDTKIPQIFAESAVAGDGSDWNLTELRLLGDISISVDVTVYDNGSHSSPKIHDRPFDGTLVFTPGALLRHGGSGEPADLAEVTEKDGMLCLEGYYELYERRLRPVFEHIQSAAEKDGTPALVTIPGLGCGQFAGKLQGQLGAALQSALERFLQTHGEAFSAIRAVYYDPYNECSNDRQEIHGTSFMTRPLAQGNATKTQLCPPTTYAEDGDDFSDCRLYSLVAWDHVSWPGNDFFAGSRCTDDGVKAAATDSMFRLTGIEGNYDANLAAYSPPRPHHNWASAVRTHGIILSSRCGL